MMMYDVLIPKWKRITKTVTQHNQRKEKRSKYIIFDDKNSRINEKKKDVEEMSIKQRTLLPSEWS